MKDEDLTELCTAGMGNKTASIQVEADGRKGKKHVAPTDHITYTYSRLASHPEAVVFVWNTSKMSEQYHLSS